MDPSQQQSMDQMAVLRERADAGDTGAMRELAAFLVQISGSARRQNDHDLADETLAASITWMRLAAEANDPLAMAIVGGTLLSDGERDEGIEWLTRATRLDSAEALNILMGAHEIEWLLNWLKEELPRGNPQARKLMRQIRSDAGLGESGG